ncbi:KDO2-lipid IV(A) lauroyltransferase [Limnobacter thiooxidans]|uniref:Lysophospholipid acyltransferase family protein n=1 Tax=Limnobacter thiooxidans TaxID=131080 RepID=A0AA86IXX2_9BURK|nr:KDO2-lipid IV(A) lauroyltransferase [Limnobacter thiooxidans]BET25294.1 lysophospholipid acyltransferase family protein [Limnobacter thiooxidans]
MTHILIGVWFALGRLPFGLYRVASTALSALLALVLFVFARERRMVALTNLSLCFPETSVTQRLLWTVKHIYFYLRTFLDRAWLWSGNAATVRDRVCIENLDALVALKGGPPTIFLAPHFLGLDAAWSRLCLEVDMVTMYSNQKNPVLNDLILQGRSKFGDQLLLSRQQGVRPLLTAMKKGRPLYYLPDMDFGERDSVFVTFFGVQAATVTAVARLSKMLQAQVVPVTTVYRNGRYHIRIHQALPDFPMDDDVQSTQAMNHHIETWVKDNIPQYLWLHKRFKTRPAGESRIY